MTNIEKAITILQATNQGEDLAKHHLPIVYSGLRGDLGDATRLIFEDLWEQYSEASTEGVNE